MTKPDPRPEDEAQALAREKHECCGHIERRLTCDECMLTHPTVLAALATTRQELEQTRGLLTESVASFAALSRSFDRERESRLQAESALAQSQRRVETLERWLFNLLAVIHRDGGHYISDHGEVKAVADAMEIVPPLLESQRRAQEAEAALNAANTIIFDERDTARAENERLMGEARHNSEGMREYMHRWDTARAEAQALREQLEEARGHLIRCLNHAPHSNRPPTMPCLCRWCKARAFLAANPAHLSAENERFLQVLGGPIPAEPHGHISGCASEIGQPCNCRPAANPVPVEAQKIEPYRIFPGLSEGGDGDGDPGDEEAAPSEPEPPPIVCTGSGWPATWLSHANLGSGTCGICGHEVGVNQAGACVTHATAARLAEPEPPADDVVGRCEKDAEYFKQLKADHVMESVGLLARCQKDREDWPCMTARLIAIVEIRARVVYEPEPPSVPAHPAPAEPRSTECEAQPYKQPCKNPDFSLTPAPAEPPRDAIEAARCAAGSGQHAFCKPAEPEPPADEEDCGMCLGPLTNGKCDYCGTRGKGVGGLHFGWCNSVGCRRPPHCHCNCNPSAKVPEPEPSKVEACERCAGKVTHHLTGCLPCSCSCHWSAITLPAAEPEPSNGETRPCEGVFIGDQHPVEHCSGCQAPPKPDEGPEPPEGEA